jgi:hypothetical protein
MSDNNRDLFGKESKPKEALLDELDSLKELLDEEGEDIIMAAPWEFTPTEERISIEAVEEAAPELDEVIELASPIEPPAQSRAEASQPEIPVLEEVVFTTDEELTAVPELIDVVETVGENEEELPGSDEMRHLIEMLVQRRLEKLKPALTEEVLQELERFYPSLKNR